jgi:hypothetical protein
MQRAFTWILRGLIFGLVLSLVIGSLALYQAKILRAEFLALVVWSVILAPILFGCIATLWRIPALEAARRFDILFRLNERVSTALELDQHPEHIPPEIFHRQLTDAVTAAHTVNLRRAFPIRLAPREGLVALLCIGLISLIWLRGDVYFRAAQQARNVEEAVKAQAEKIVELIEQIEANEALTDEQKAALTEPLKEALRSLEENPSLENAVSALTKAEEQLQALNDPQADQALEALQEAGEELANQEGSPLENVGEELAQGDLVDAAEELSNIDLSQLSEEELQQLAEQLESLADSVEAANPELAEQLNEAAEAIQSGDIQAAQQALNESSETLAQTGGEIASAQVAGEAVTQLQEGAEQVLAAGGGGESAQGSNQGNQNSGNGESASGSGSEAGSNPNGSEAGTEPIAQTSKSNGGESQYEQIYAPQLLGGDEGQQVDLPSSDQNGGDVIGESLTTSGDESTSTVPYNEVFSTYDEANNEAIENGDVPTEFINIIKKYFDSLKP